MDVGTPFTGDGAGVSYPASLAQSRFWLLDALDPGTPSLNVAVRWSLLGPVSHHAVEAAMRRIVGRHEILRTALQNADGVPVQVVRPALPFQVGSRDLTDMPAEAALAEADRIGAEEARTPFALESPPLIRVTLIKLAADSARLLLTMHHAVCDGWSVGVVADEMTRYLAGAPMLPDLPLQYGDYADWQQAWLRSPALDAANAYWLRQLADLPYVSVPPDHSAERRGPGAIASTLLPRALTDAMSATAVRQGCTPFAVALAALGCMLQARTGADDIPVGTQVAGRTEVELEGMIGPFINTLVLRLDLSGAPEWEARVARAARTAEEALDHHAMPFELLIRALNPRRSQRRTPLFSVNFIFQRSFVAPFTGGGIQLVDLPSHSAGALYDLNFFMVERPDGWRLSCEYDTALFDAPTVDAMLGEWRQALSGQAVAPADATGTVLDRLGLIWCDILGLPGVAPTDGFFDLGGHSLLAARMLARVEAEFGQRVGMAALFTDNTLGALAARLAPQGAPDGGRPAIIVLGDAAGLQAAMGAGITVHCLADATVARVNAVCPSGRLAILGTGPDGGAALALAHAVHEDGRDAVLVLVDAVPPVTPRGFWRQLRPSRTAAPRFAGRTLLFRPAVPAGDAMGGWGSHLAGAIEVATLPAGAWQDAVAQRLKAALA